MTILLVEQNARKALAIANKAYVLETGKIVLQGPAAELQNMDQVRKAYLGERSNFKTYSVRKEVQIPEERFDPGLWVSHSMSGRGSQGYQNPLIRWDKKDGTKRLCKEVL